MMLAPDGAAAVDEILIAELQRRLRGAGGPKPKDQYVRLALALARDPALVPMRVCKAAAPPVTSSCTRARIIGYRDRILREGLLAAGSSQSAEPRIPVVHDR